MRTEIYFIITNIQVKLYAYSKIIWIPEIRSQMLIFKYYTDIINFLNFKIQLNPLTNI